MTTTATATTIPPYLPIVTCLLFGICAITTPRSPIISTLSISWGLYWLFSMAINRPHAGKEYMEVYMVGVWVFGAVARTVSAVLLMEGKDFERRVEGEGEKVDGKEESKKKKKKKRGILGWVFDVVDIGLMNPRAVGRNFQIRNLAPQPPNTISHLSFVTKNLTNALIDLALVDLTFYHFKHNTPFGSHPISSLRSQPFPLAWINAWLIYLQARWTTDAFYNILSCITVPLHIYPPSAFPPLYGSFKHAYTIRRFWAYTWHQMLRNLALPYTNFLVASLKLDRNSKSTYWVKVSLAFFWAWAIHAYGTFIAGGGLAADTYRYVPQVIGFWIEEVVVQWAVRMGVKESWWTRVVGYVWLFCWQGWGLVRWVEPGSLAGAYLKAPLPFSLVEWLVGAK